MIGRGLGGKADIWEFDLRIQRLVIRHGMLHYDACTYLSYLSSSDESRNLVLLPSFDGGCIDADAIEVVNADSFT